MRYWRFLDLPLTQCEIELNLSWSKNSTISRTLRTAAEASNTNVNPPVHAREATQTRGAILHMTSSQLYVPVATLPINDKDS